MTLEEKAEKYARKTKKVDWEGFDVDKEARKEGYIAGATENCIIWHDMMKNPDDLPKNKEFKITDKGNIGFYDSHWEKWYYWNSNEMVYPPIAWTEIPKFEEV